MNVREAILKAADQIEREPDSYRFLRIEVHKGCGTPMCVLGWVGHFLDSVPNGTCVANVANDVFAVNEMQFYGRMNDLQGFLGGEGDWHFNAKSAARVLRLYADRYHPAEEPERDYIPESVGRCYAKV